jgi:hypothetical protein
MRWNVGIAGRAAILHQLAIVVSNDDIRLDIHGDRVLLTGTRLDAFGEVANVRREAERIVTILSAFARLLFGSLDSLCVVDVTKVGEPEVEDAASAPFGGAQAFQALRPVTVPDTSGASEAWPKSSLFQSLRLVLSNPAMEAVLSLRDTSRLDWSRLVQMCRLIEEATRRLPPGVGFSRIPQKAIQRLYDAASRAGEIGQAHGEGKVAESSSRWMTLPEAGNLIDRLIITWLGSAARHSHAARLGRIAREGELVAGANHSPTPSSRAKARQPQRTRTPMAGSGPSGSPRRSSTRTSGWVQDRTEPDHRRTP